MGQLKEYFVFISYSNKDVEWAEWLQQELEHYKLPATFNGNSNVRDNLRDVFRDRDELAAGQEWDAQVEQALANTSNLVVVCSPDAAVSEAVDREIEFFVRQGKGDRIFPFIVAGNSPAECFPPSLSYKKIGGDVNKDGSCNKAFAKVVAGILGVGFDSVWQRYERDKANREKEIREQRDNLFRVQSRFVTERARAWLDEGNGLRAVRLLLEALPKSVGNPDDRPLVVEAERLLREAVGQKSAVIKFCVDERNFGNGILGRMMIWCIGNVLWSFNIDTGDCNSVEIDFEGIRLMDVNISEGLVACASWGEICVFDFHSSRVLYRFPWKGGYAINGIAFSRDGKLLMVQDPSDNYICDYLSGKIYSQYSLDDGVVGFYNENIPRFDLSGQGDQGDYYAQIAGNLLKVFKRDTGECVVFVNDWLPKEGVAFFNPSDGSFVYQILDGTIKSLSIDTGKVKVFDYKIPYVLRAAKMLPESGEIALLLHENDVERVEYVRLAVIKDDRFIETGPLPGVHGCRISGNSKFVAGIVRDQSGAYSVGFWYLGQNDVEDAALNLIAPDCTIARSQMQMLNIAISGDCSVVAVYYVNNTIGFYSVFDGSCIGTMRPHKDVVNDMAFSPCGRFFATASDDCTIKIMAADSVLGTIKCSKAVRYLQFDKSGELIAAVHENTVKLYSVSSRKCLKSLKMGQFCFDAQFSPCNRYVLASSRSSIKVFDVSTGECVNKIDVDCNANPGLCFINDAGDFVIRSSNYGYYKGNVLQPQLERVFGCGGNGFGDILCSNNREYLLIGEKLLQRSGADVESADSEEDWNVTSKRFLSFMDSGVLVCGNVSDCPDSDQQAAASQDKYELVVQKDSVFVLDAADKKTLCEFRGISKGEPVIKAWFSDDGNSVVFVTATYDERRTYRREFKPIQELIDETAERYRQSELTKEEREQCYLD